MALEIDGFGVALILGRAERGGAGPDVLVGDVVGVFCGDVDGVVSILGECGGEVVGPGMGGGMLVFLIKN